MKSLQISHTSNIIILRVDVYLETDQLLMAARDILKNLLFILAVVTQVHFFSLKCVLFSFKRAGLMAHEMLKHIHKLNFESGCVVRKFKI